MELTSHLFDDDAPLPVLTAPATLTVEDGPVLVMPSVTTDL